MDCLFHQPRPDKIGIGNHFKRRLLERQDGVGSSRRKIRSQPGTVVLKHLQVLAHLSAGWGFGVRHDLRRRMPPTDREWHVYKKGVAPAPKVVLHHFDPRQPCPHPNIVFVIGGPGSGKGTMCELAQMQLGWTHLSTGELVRAEITAGGPQAAAIDALLKDGKLAPAEMVVGLLKRKMESVTRTTGKINFLLDGFPRSLGNMDAWHQVYGTDSELPKMLYFECPFEVLEKRILGRAKYSGRNDDNIDSIKLRFDTFKEETLPTVELFKKANKCVEIDSSKDRQSVYNLVANHLSEHTDEVFADKPLTDRAMMLLGLKPFPKE